MRCCRRGLQKGVGLALHCTAQMAQPQQQTAQQRHWRDVEADALAEQQCGGVEVVVQRAGHCTSGVQALT